MYYLVNSFFPYQKSVRYEYHRSPKESIRSYLSSLSNHLYNTFKLLSVEFVSQIMYVPIYFF